MRWRVPPRLPVAALTGMPAALWIEAELYPARPRRLTPGAR